MGALRILRAAGEAYDADLIELPDDDDGPVCRSCRFAVDAVDDDELCERCADPTDNRRLS